MFLGPGRLPQTGQTAGLLAPYLNADTVNAFFRQFEQEVDPLGRKFKSLIRSLKTDS